MGELMEYVEEQDVIHCFLTEWFQDPVNNLSRDERYSPIGKGTSLRKNKSYDQNVGYVLPQHSKLPATPVKVPIHQLSNYLPEGSIDFQFDIYFILREHFRFPFIEKNIRKIRTNGLCVLTTHT